MGKSLAERLFELEDGKSLPPVTVTLNNATKRGSVGIDTGRICVCDPAYRRMATDEWSGAPFVTDIETPTGDVCSPVCQVEIDDMEYLLVPLSYPGFTRRAIAEAFKKR